MRNQKTDTYISELLTITKAIAIICVVVGHTLLKPISNFVYIFHLPVFYFIAGYFFKDIYTSNIIGYVKKRIRKLYIPLLKYGVIFLVLHNLFFKINIYSDVYGYMSNVSSLYTIDHYLHAIKYLILGDVSGCGNLLGAMWFLRSLLFSSVVFCILVSFSKRFNKSLLILGILIAFVVVIFNYVPFSSYYIPFQQDIARDMMTLPYLYLGYFTNKFKSAITPSIVFLLLSLFMLLTTSVMFPTTIKSHYEWLLEHYVISFIGVFFIINISSYLERTMFKRIFLMIGSYTFEIMALHFLSFKIVSLIQILAYGYDIKYLSQFPVIETNTVIWFIPYSIAGIFFPILMVRSFQLFKRYIFKESLGNKI